MFPSRTLPFCFIAATLMLAGCATLDGKASGFSLSADGYATQTKISAKVEKPSRSKAIEFPKVIGTGAHLENAQAQMTDIFNSIPSVYESSYDMTDNRLKISVALTSDEFAKTEIPTQYRTASNIEFTLLPDVLSESPLDPEVAPYMRAFEVSPHYSNIVLASLSRGYVRLQDGCLYMHQSGKSTAIMLRREAGLRLDKEGYVEIYNRIFPDQRGTRPGHEMGWGDGSRDVSDTDGGKRLMQACGSETTSRIGMPGYMKTGNFLD